MITRQSSGNLSIWTHIQVRWALFVLRLCNSIFGWKLHRDPSHPLNLAVKISLIALIFFVTALVQGVAFVIFSCALLPLLGLGRVLLILAPWQSYASRPIKLRAGYSFVRK
jgi:hypothetical protein